MILTITMRSKCVIARSIYSYPAASDSSSESDSVPPTMRSRHKQATQFERLLALKQEIAALEREMGGTLSVTTTHDNERDAAGIASKGPGKRKAAPGKEALKDDTLELLKGVHDVRVRLEKVEAARESRGRLVDAVVTGSITRPTGILPHAYSHGSPPPHGHGVVTPLSPTLHAAPALNRLDSSIHRREGSFSGSHSGVSHAKSEDAVDPVIAKLDSRLGELERIVGSSGAALDESSSLPPPLLPMLTRLNAQLTILTQPRTIDSISRRLKLLLTDLDRIAATNTAGQGSGAATSGAAAVPGKAATGTAPGGTTGGGTSGGSVGGSAGVSTIQEQLTPILQRLAPHLPTLPHILARLRTLSSLHAAASDFQRSIDQVRWRLEH